MPELCGSTTVSASIVAMAASAALPPARNISTPAAAARGSAAETAPPSRGRRGAPPVAQAARRKARARSRRLQHQPPLFSPDRIRQAREAVPREQALQLAVDSAAPGPAPDRPERCRAGRGSPRPGSGRRRRRRSRSRRPRSAAARRRSRGGNRAAARSASAFSGAPDRPPASPRCCDLSGGRLIVRVGDDQRVDLPRRSRSGRWRRSAAGSRSGATLRKIGGPAPARLGDRRQQRVERAFVLQVACRPGVFGEEMLTVR